MSLHRCRCRRCRRKELNWYKKFWDVIGHDAVKLRFGSCFKKSS